MFSVEILLAKCDLAMYGLPNRYISVILYDMVREFMFSLSFSLFIVQLNINILLVRLSGRNLSKGAWSALSKYPVKRSSTSVPNLVLLSLNAQLLCIFQLIHLTIDKSTF